MNREEGLCHMKLNYDDHELENYDSKRNQISNENEQNNVRGNLSDGEDSCDIDVKKDDQDGYMTDGYLEHVDNHHRRKHEDPGHDDVDSLPFYKFFCYRLEKMWKRKREKQAHKRWKEKERLEYVLPRKMLTDLNGQTIFPYLRLLIPEQDSRRQFRVKEKKIAEAYCKAQGFGKGTKNYEALMVRKFGIARSTFVLL